MKITDEVFQDLVTLLTEVGGYDSMAAYSMINQAMNGSEYAIKFIERTIMRTAV